MFNLSNLDTESKQEQGAWLHLVNPATGELAYIDEEQEKPCRIKFKGWHSKAGKAIGLKGRNKALRDAKKNGNKSKDITLTDLKESAESDAESLAELALDWENILDEDGKPVKFTKEAFYNAAFRALDLRRQALEFINNQAVFFEA